jgi:aspartate aminotransferase
MDLSMYLLAEANVATVTGDAFGNLTVFLLPRDKWWYSKEALKLIKDALAANTFNDIVKCPPLYFVF